LVDSLGELDDAIAAAARLAALDRYEWRYVEQPLTPGEEFAQELIRNFGMATLGGGQWLQGLGGTGIQQTLEGVTALTRFNDPRDLYTLCEFCGVLRPD